jgi:LuxR family maltose regulon positive regulatory protein
LPLNAVEQKLVEIALPMLINELAELPHRVVVVLDDYQFITEGECHESVAFFVEHLPANVHLVLSSPWSASFARASRPKGSSTMSLRSGS